MAIAEGVGQKNYAVVAFFLLSKPCYGAVVMHGAPACVCGDVVIE